MLQPHESGLLHETSQGSADGHEQESPTAIDMPRGNPGLRLRGATGQEDSEAKQPLQQRVAVLETQIARKGRDEGQVACVPGRRRE